ncbi:MAG: hypothetical protein L0H31_10275, partial [Nocardioidaceae bacterium]|nr:hypothetical protein [Nocardioidaceae bacterium]
MKDLVDGRVRRVTTSTVLPLQLALGLATGASAGLLGWEAAGTERTRVDVLDALVGLRDDTG